jgi:hypothetical protein
MLVFLAQKIVDSGFLGVQHRRGCRTLSPERFRRRAARHVEAARLSAGRAVPNTIAAAGGL